MKKRMLCKTDVNTGTQQPDSHHNTEDKTVILCMQMCEYGSHTESTHEIFSECCCC